jgi:hypothetical protein
LATAVAAAGIGAIGATAGASPLEQAISNLAMAGHAASASSANHPTATVFDAVIGVQPQTPAQAPKAQEPAGDLQLDSHEDSTPGIVGTLSRDAEPAPAAGGAADSPPAAVNAVVPQPAGAQPSAPRTQPALVNIASGSSAPDSPSPAASATVSALASANQDPAASAPASPSPTVSAPASPSPTPAALVNIAPGSPSPTASAPDSPSPAAPAIVPGNAAHSGTAHADAAHVAAAPARHAHAPHARDHHAAVHHAPVKPYQIYDSVTPGSIPWHHTAAVYANGAYAASSAQVAGRGHVLWIDTNGSDPRADALDVEPGDATPAGAAAWVQAKLSADHNHVAIVYTMRSQWQAVRDNVAGLPHWMQDKVRYWIADPTGVDHVVPGSNATQWYWGKNYDITTANPGFWS